VGYGAENYRANFAWVYARAPDCDVRCVNRHVHKAEVFAGTTSADDSRAALNPLVTRVDWAGDVVVGNH
jgi:hypothetical protein